MIGLVISASLLAAPQPIRFETWFSEDDFPASATEQEKTAFRPVTQTLVDAHGKIVGCRLETPSANPEIDGLACGIIVKRGRFAPAHWIDGSAAAGIYRAPIGFAMDGDKLPPAGDIELEVASLPDGKKSSVSVTVDYAADENGRVVGCVPGFSPGAHPAPPNPALLALACQTVTAEWKPFTVLGENGKKARSVQNATVLFSVPKAPR